MNRFENRLSLARTAKRLPAVIPGNALENERNAEHRVIPDRIFNLDGMPDVCDAFIDRNPAADRENADRDDKRPEVTLAPVAERMFFVGRFGASLDAVEHQQPVSGIDDRVNSL